MELLTRDGKQTNGSSDISSSKSLKPGSVLPYMVGAEGWQGVEGFADVIKLRDGEIILDYPGAPSVIIKGLIKWGRRLRVRKEMWRCYAADFKDRIRNATQGTQQTLEVGKGRGADSLLDPLEGTHPCQYLSFSLERPNLDSSELQNWVMLNLC